MSIKAHGLLEDIGAEIGYTATAQLVDWFGGGHLWVPETADESHAICLVIGLPAFKRLVAWFDNPKKKGLDKNERLIWINYGYQREIDRRDRMIALLYAKGSGSREISNVTGMSMSHVQQVRRRVEDMGVLPLILRQAGLGFLQQKTTFEPEVESSVFAEKSKTKPTPKIRSKPKTQTTPPAKKAVAHIHKRAKRY